MPELETRVVFQREAPPLHTGGWTVQRDVTKDLEELRDALDRLTDPHEGAEIDPQAEDIETARVLIDMILGDGGAGQ